MGLMGAAGRIGALVSAWPDHGWCRERRLFGVLGLLMIINMTGFLAVRGHIPRLARGRTEDF
jgi:AAHS family 4-hydroxybenzoate transporter-like MFS transporter